MSDYYLHPVLTLAPVDYRELKTAAIRMLSEESLNAVSSGQSLATLRGLGRDEIQARLAEGRALAEAGDFERAFSIAFDLYLLDPREYRHAFLAGMCMYELGRPEDALAFYFAAERMGAPPEALFGMAQCCEALDDCRSAMRFYDRVGEMTRSQTQYEDLHESATDAAHSLYTRQTQPAVT